MFKAMRRKLKTPWGVWCVEICCDILHSPKVHAEDPNFWKAPAGQRFGTIEAPLRWCCAEARAPCLAKNGKCKYGEACKFAASGATTGPDDGKLIGVEGITDADSACTLDGSDVHAQVAISRKLQCCWSPMFHFWQVLFGSSPCSNRFLAAAEKFHYRWRWPDGRSSFLWRHLLPLLVCKRLASCCGIRSATHICRLCWRAPRVGRRFEPKEDCRCGILGAFFNRQPPLQPGLWCGGWSLLGLSRSASLWQLSNEKAAWRLALAFLCKHNTTAEPAWACQSAFTHRSYVST